MKNIFSVDVEDWYHINFPSVDNDLTKRESRVEGNFYRLLDLLNQYNAKATFFFLGCIAEQFPSLVYDAALQGHEIASHGYNHKLVYNQTESEFYEDVSRARDIIQTITNKGIFGYRAPSWSISRQTPWAYDVLARLGFKYDASLFPFNTFLYGDGKAPVRAHQIRVFNGYIHEMPMSVLEIFNLRLPFSGGFYMRFLPYWVIKSAAYQINKKDIPVIYYVHPREIDPDQPRLKLSIFDQFIAYYGLRSTETKIKRILNQGPTITIREFLKSSISENYLLK
jgi:polysaccharide deacetylase family protein (PEP-CTERM system associated)